MVSLTQTLPPPSLSSYSIKEVVVVVAVVSVATVVGSEVTLVALVMTRGDLARDLTRVETEDSPTEEEGEGTRRKHGTEKWHLSLTLLELVSQRLKQKHCQFN